jgi:hypothetical protein
MNIAIHPYWPRCNTREKDGSPPPPPAPIPPVTSSSADVMQAQNQQRRDAAKRQGYASTLLAGETGGAMKSDQSSKSLLG